MNDDLDALGPEGRARLILPPHFQDLRFLGAGGSGQVFRAHDTRLDRTVAIKILAPANTPSEGDELERRFEREALALKRLHHFSIVEILDVSARGPHPYLVMEHVEGRTLGDFLRPVRSLDVRHALELGLAIAEGLAHAHSRGIIHRDIKPDNIILPKDGGVKILDFGLARVAGTTTITSDGVMLGTLPYMAPEQIRGATVTPATDVYALGVILYQMLTGKLPLSPEEIWARERRTPDPPSTHNAQVSARLDAIVMECLAADPSSRFQGAHELTGPLAQCRDELASHEGQPSRWDALLGADLERLSWAFASRVAAPLVLVDAQIREMAALRVVLDGLPPETGQHRVVRQQCLRALTRCVEARGGLVDRYDAVGLWAVFGGGEGSADHATTALEAALRLRERIEVLAPLIGGELHGRIAVDLERRATGPGALAEDRTAPPLLALLETAAGGDRASAGALILASPEVCRRLRTGWAFRAHPLGEARMAFALDAEPPAFAPRRVEGLGSAPLLGRDTTLARLVALRDRYASRAGQDATIAPALIVIAGEAGAGKSRLATALLESPGTPALVWRGVAAPGVSIPYAPIATALRAVAGLPAQSTSAQTVAQLATLAARPDDPGDTVSAWALAFLMGATSSPHAQAPRDPQQLRRRLQDSVIEILRKVAAGELASRKGPPVLLLEDLQWADGHTIDLVDRLLAQSGVPLLVIATHRTGFKPPSHWLGTEDRLSLALEPLDDASIVSLSAHLTGGPPDTALAGALTRLAAGNPYYLEELLCLWIAQGRVVQRNGTFTLAGGPPGGIPAPIESILLARMDLMDREARQVVQMAAVLGEDCEASVLRAMGQHLAPPLTHMEQTVEGLIGEGVLERSGRSLLAFRHTLLHEAAHRSLLAVNRQRLHLAAGLALEEGARTGNVADPRRLVRHFLRARDRVRAAAWAASALEAAALAYDHPGLLAIAQDLLDLYGEDPAQRADVFHVLSRRERILELIGERARQEQDLLRMRALALASGNQSRLADAQNRLSWFFWWNRADYFKAKELALSALALKRRLKEPRGEAEALRNLGSIHYYLGNLRESIGYHTRALALYRTCHDAEGEAASLCSIGINETRLFHFARALAVVHESLALDRAQGDRRGEGRALRIIGDVLRETGALDQAAEHYRAALAIDREIGYLQGALMNVGSLASVAAGRGATDEAQAFAQEALDIALAIGAVHEEAMGNVRMAEVLRTRERPEDLAPALMHVRKGLELATTAGLHGLVVRAMANEGVVLALLGQTDEGVAKTAAAEAMAGPGPYAEVYPYEIHWLHHLALSRAGRAEEAEKALAQSRQALLAQSRQIDAKPLAESYLADVPLHRQILGDPPAGQTRERRP